MTNRRAHRRELIDFHSIQGAARRRSRVSSEVASEAPTLATSIKHPERHEYELLYLAVEDIDHTRTKTKSPQTNGICERFHRTVLDEFYRDAVVGRHRMQSGRRCFWKPTPPLTDLRPSRKSRWRQPP